MRETSSVTIRTVLGYVREQAGEQVVDSVLERAELPDSRAQLEDPNHWVSYESRIRLFEAVVEHFGEPSVMYEIGRSSLRQNVAPSVTLAMRSIGSPAKIYRYLPRLVSKYSTTSTMRLLESGSTHATFSFRLHDGYQHSRLDCLYAQGLIASIPEGFGLPPARIFHPECESDGAAACLYQVTWARWYRWSRRRRRDSVMAELESAALRRQLADLRGAAGDLVGGDDLSHVLQRVVERAATAVLARGYLLAVRDQDGHALVHAHGLTEPEVDALATDLLDHGDLGPSAVVVDVASAHRHHGRLAALHGPDQQGLTDDRVALRGYARHAAAALDMMSALEDSRRDAQRARALLELAHQLTDAGEPQSIAEIVSDALPGIVGCESAGVWIWDEDSRLLRASAHAGGTDEVRRIMSTATISPDDTPELAALLADPQPLLLTSGAVGSTLEALLQAIEINYSIVVPLLASERFYGVATASWRTQPTSRDSNSDLMLRLRGVGHQAASALRNALLAEKVRRQADHDELTGLPNRRVFLQRLDQALDGQRRGDLPTVGVLFCDLDGFKDVNDRHGHAAGDELLRQVARRLCGAVRDGDQVARLSGDEFAVLLPGIVDVHEAEAVAERIVGSLADPCTVENLEVRVTVSVGISLSVGSAGHGDRLLRDADQAMYVAKQRGRNQVAGGAPIGAPRQAPPALDRLVS